MKKIYYFLLFLLLVSCSDNPPTKSKAESEPSSVGWEPAGFVPDAATLYTRGSGLQKVAHSGEWVLLEDAWTSPVEGKPGYLTYSPRLFISKLNSKKWDTLTVPSKGYVLSIFADSTGFYIGTYTTGQVLKYLPNEKKWEEVYVVDSTDNIEYDVYGIGKYDGRLIVSLAGFTDSLRENIKSIQKMQNGDSWTDLETPPMRMYYGGQSDSTAIPLHFHKGVEWNGQYYVATQNGVWILNSEAKSWTQMPLPPFAKWEEANKATFSPIQEIVIHKNNLVVIPSGSDVIYQWNSQSNLWNSIDSLYLKYYDEDGDYIVRTNTPSDKKALLSDGKHLFVAGSRSPPPMVYMGDYGEPYGNIKKGWRSILKGWCGKYKCVSTDATYSLDVIDGYLYAAAYEGLFRFPLSELDNVIANEEDFFGM